MSGKALFALFGTVAGLAVIDYVAFGGAGSLFLAREFIDLVEFLAFWR